MYDQFGNLVWDRYVTDTSFAATQVAEGVQQNLETFQGELESSPGAQLVGFQQVGTGAVLRQALEKMREWVSPEDYGAAGDGVTPDDAAFDRLATALASGVVQNVRCQAKTYLFESPTRFDVNAAPGEITFVGDRTIFKFGGLTGARPFVFRNGSGLTVQGINFVCTRTDISQNCLDIMNYSNVSVEQCSFQGATFYGLGIYEDTIGGTATACNNITVRGNTFRDVGVFGFEHFPKVTSDGCEIYENIFINCGINPLGIATDPAAMKPGQATKNARVHDNKILGAPHGGIFLGQYEDIEAYNNTIVDPVSYGISLGVYASHSSGYIPSNRMALVRDNTVRYSPGFANDAASINVNGTATENGPVIVSNNTVIGGGQRALECTPATAIPNISFVGNTVDGNTGLLPVRITSAGGAAPVAVAFTDNTVINRNYSLATHRVEFNGCPNPTILRNKFVDMGTNALQLTSCSGVVSVESNVFDGYNVTNASNVGAINVNDTSSTTYSVRNNTLKNGNGYPKALYNGNSATPVVNMSGNAIPGGGVAMLINSTPTISVNGAMPVAQRGRLRTFQGTAAPTTGGVYIAGDKVENTSPAAGGVVGWVCTVGGSPGTWKSYGGISS
ncbi:right-handed parallel beta-helix repeat-containing protein [Pigmentiphaga sp. YJ18]|uniref:right-handed parallel beta-helix repeat-containing protein n=1 Tax=Pigmentiphaga sp. YJ18 TaxID=3134907 RepID=UPI0031189675